MKKQILFIGVLVLSCLCLAGCGNKVDNNKEEKKEEKNLSVEITNYFKKNLDKDWEYSEEKFKVNSDNSVEIIYNNVDDWSFCGYSSRNSILNLNKSDSVLKEIPTVTFICNSNGNIVGKVVYENISSITKDNVNINLKIYDASNNIISTSIDEGFKASCAEYKYKEIFRNPENYFGKAAKVTGEVIQVTEETVDGLDYWVLRVNMTKDQWGYYDDTIMIMIEKDAVSGRIIEDDIFTFYGRLSEPITYETIFGANQTVPAMLAYYGELKN